MDPLLTGATAASIILMILMIVIVSRLGQDRARSIARVEALQTLVAESSAATQSPTPDLDPDLDDDDWDLNLREQEPAEARRAAPAESAVATMHQFVVTVPETGASRHQLSFTKQWP